MVTTVGKILGVGLMVLAFVSIDTCGKNGFKPKNVGLSRIDTTSIVIGDKRYIVLKSKSGDLEVLNTIPNKKE